MTYTDRTKFRKDGKYLNRTKKEKDTAYPSLPARQKKLKEAEMIARAQALEDACSKGKISVKDPNKPILATDYLEQMENVTDYATSERAINDRKRIIKEFVEWLKEHKQYKKLYLHEVTRLVTKEYISSLVKQGLSYGTIKKRRKALSTVWRLIEEELEDAGSTVTLINPFTNSRALRSVLPSDEEIEAEGKVMEVEKRAFTMDQVREIIARMTYYKPLLAKIWRLGFLTGWRVGDIRRIKWDQIDFTNRTLTVISSKTKLKTVIYLTDSLLAMFNEIRENSSDPSPNQRVFAYKGDKAYYIQNRKVLDDMGLTETAKSGKVEKHLYTFHSLRGTMKTALKVKDYNESRLDYLAGHRGKGVDPKHYDKFSDNPKAATKDIIEFLESVLDGEIEL